MTDPRDANNAANNATGHRWGNGWQIHDRNDLIALIENNVIGTVEEYDHYDSFEEMAAFVLGRGPYLNHPGFGPSRQDDEHINEHAPAGLDWQQLQTTYECLDEPGDSRHKRT